MGEGMEKKIFCNSAIFAISNESILPATGGWFVEFESVVAHELISKPNPKAAAIGLIQGFFRIILCFGVVKCKWLPTSFQFVICIYRRLLRPISKISFKNSPVY